MSIPLRQLLIVLVLSMAAGCSVFRPTEEELPLSKSIIPLPASVDWGKGVYKLPTDNRICYNEEAEEAALWMQELLKQTSTNVSLAQGNSCGNINLVRTEALRSEVGEEGYLLEIDQAGISIRSGTEAGLFYGIQSLRQLFPPAIESSVVEKEILLPFVDLRDQPHFSWRGTMVDVARSFFGLDYLKRHVDRMALYKLNRLHLHLSDDQGWRLEIKGKPRLTEVGSKGAVKGGNSGFLTQAEYKELQDYALARNITIIPEIDMPGHIYAALVAYPELNCEGFTNLTPARATPPELFREYNVGWSKFCLDKPEVYDFVSEVLKEVASITKGPWIHIGGDEIKDPRYREFVVRADSIVRSLGKTSIGWEEVTQAEVDESLISQRWRGTVEGVVDVKVIHSLCSQFYFDHGNIPGQENTNNWCKKDGVSLKNAYSFDDYAPNVIGVEAPVWTEFVLDQHMLDNRFWPRTLAVAEIGWTPPDMRNFQDFLLRTGAQGGRLGEMGIHFFLTPEIQWSATEVEANPTGVFAGFLPETKR